MYMLKRNIKWQLWKVRSSLPATDAEQICPPPPSASAVSIFCAAYCHHWWEMSRLIPGIQTTTLIPWRTSILTPFSSSNKLFAQTSFLISTCSRSVMSCRLVSICAYMHVYSDFSSLMSDPSSRHYCCLTHFNTPFIICILRHPHCISQHPSPLCSTPSLPDLRPCPSTSLSLSPLDRQHLKLVSSY